MINYNNHNITGISYNNHSIKYVYGCGGNLVWSGGTGPTPPPVFNGKWKATYQDSHTESAECGSSSAISRYEIENLNLVSVEVGNCVTSLANEAFMLSVSLTSITLPDGLTSIGNNAFDDCASLTGITIPNSVTNIGEYAFDTCSGLTTVNIPSGVTNIKQSTFYSCSGLTSIDIPSGVTTIGTYAFGYCSNLTTVTVNAITPPTADYGVFFKTNDALVIYVPDESVNAYKAARNWSTYADRIKPVSEKP